MNAPSLEWSPWHPLREASKNGVIPHSPGLYRIRRAGHTDLDYIGQTGVSLRGRLGALRGAYDEQMPYGDPHTAAPALWALRHAERCEFEVSVSAVEGSTPMRKGMVALAIGLYRREYGKSPTVEFGRMPPGYRKSSPNNARLVKLGKRFRGGPCDDTLPSHGAGVPPVGPLTGSPQSPAWTDHCWSEWTHLTAMKASVPASGVGLYRIRGDEQDSLLYIGQGVIPARPLAHLTKIAILSHRQGEIFGSGSRLECSWVLNDSWLPHQRLELETDLIAAHMIEIGEIPRAQFLG